MPGSFQSGTAVLSGCTKVTKVLNANFQECTIWCAATTKVGIGLSAFQAGSVVTFQGSADGLQWHELSVAQYPDAMAALGGPQPASGVQTASAAGNFETIVQNWQFIRCVLTTGNGPVSVIMAASVDSSYQEAFLVGQSGVNLAATLYPSTTAASGPNTLTIPGQANRLINLTFLEVAMVGPNFGNAMLRIWDTAVGNGVPLYSCFLTANAGSVGSVQLINLPTDAQGNKGIQGSLGNPLVVQIVNVGTATIINARASML